MDITPISAVSKALPNTFVPDMGDELPTVTPLPDGGASAGAANGGSFVDTLKGFLGDVNDKINASDQASRDLATGRTNDLGKVVTSVQEANLALELTTSVRQKILEAYSEISRMQV